MLAILLIPAALCYTFGKMVGDTRQGWAILAAMTIIFVLIAGSRRLGRAAAATRPSPRWASIRLPAPASPAATWKARRCASASPTPPCGPRRRRPRPTARSMPCTIRSRRWAGWLPMWLMQLGEVVFGGVGSGLYGMLVFVIVAVFVAGLMVGRTPEYLGKKIEAYEMKMAALVILIPPMLVLVGTALAVVHAGGPRRHLQPWAARLQRGALCLFVGGQQQRQRLRRAERQHAVLQPGARRGDAGRALSG